MPSFSFEAQENNNITCYLFMLVIKSTGNCDLITATKARLAKGNLINKQEMKDVDGLSVDFLNPVQEADNEVWSLNLLWTSAFQKMVRRKKRTQHSPLPSIKVLRGGAEPHATIADFLHSSETAKKQVWTHHPSTAALLITVFPGHPLLLLLLSCLCSSCPTILRLWAGYMVSLYCSSKPPQRQQLHVCNVITGQFTEFLYTYNVAIPVQL